MARNPQVDIWQLDNGWCWRIVGSDGFAVAISGRGWRQRSDAAKSLQRFLDEMPDAIPPAEGS